MHLKNKYSNLFSCLILATLAFSTSSSHAFDFERSPDSTFKFNLSGNIENKTNTTYNANADKDKKFNTDNSTLSSIAGRASANITRDFNVFGALGFANQVSKNSNNQNFIKYLGIRYKQLSLKAGSYYVFGNSPVWFHNLATTVTYQPSESQSVSFTYALPEKDSLLPFNMFLVDSKYLGDSYYLGIKVGYGTFNYSYQNPRKFNSVGVLDNNGNITTTIKPFDFSNNTAKLFVGAFTANYMTAYNFNINFTSTGVKTDNSYFTINSADNIVTNNAYSIGMYDNNNLVTTGGSSYYLSNCLSFSYVGGYAYTPEFKISYETISQQNEAIATKFVQNFITPALSVKIYPTAFLPVSTQGSEAYTALSGSYLYTGVDYKIVNQTTSYPQALDIKTHDHEVNFFGGININF